MKTSKGTIQGYNGITTVDKKHQIIIDAQAFGGGPEQHALQPVLDTIKARYSRLGISEDIYEDGVIITADTGFASEKNMEYLYEHKINGYIPDKGFRSRDPKFTDQKAKYGKRSSKKVKSKNTAMFSAKEFEFDSIDQSCICPAGEPMWLSKEGIDNRGNHKIYFEGRLTSCRDCKVNHQCMKNPCSANAREGHGRQVSFIIEKKRKANFTDWMKYRIDSDEGKQIYSHRMSVVEPVFGNIGSNKKLNRFSLRSKKKVQWQWQLYSMVHNIEKYGKMAA